MHIHTHEHQKQTLLLMHVNTPSLSRFLHTFITHVALESFLRDCVETNVPGNRLSALHIGLEGSQPIPPFRTASTQACWLFGFVHELPALGASTVFPEDYDPDSTFPKHCISSVLTILWWSCVFKAAKLQRLPSSSHVIIVV